MKKAVLLALFLGVLLTVQAQDVISTAGGTIKDGTCVIDWTLGEVVTMTLTADGMSATQGFQQPICIPEFSFSDPCSCDDPENVIGGDGFVVRYHDQITIASATGGSVDHPFKIVDVLEGTVLTKDGDPIVNSPTVLSIQDGDNQVIDLWRLLGPSYKVTLENTVTGERFEVAADTDCIPCPQIPSMGAWALFIFFLTLTNIALIKLREGRFT